MVSLRTRFGNSIAFWYAIIQFDEFTISKVVFHANSIIWERKQRIGVSLENKSEIN